MTIFFNIHIFWIRDIFFDKKFFSNFSGKLRAQSDEIDLKKCVFLYQNVRFLSIGKKFLLRKTKFKADYVRKFSFSLKKANRYFSVKISSSLPR
jgi:hypothetical protein